jgi:tetratricopeptide (TPR) repeat protein
MDKNTATSGLSRLRRFAVTRYDLEELKTLCFDLGVNFDDLPGDGLSAKARELVLYMGRNQELERLLEALKSSRPEVFSASGLTTDWAEVRSLQDEVNREAVIDLLRGVQPVLGSALVAAALVQASSGLMNWFRRRKEDRTAPQEEEAPACREGDSRATPLDEVIREASAADLEQAGDLWSHIGSYRQLTGDYDGAMDAFREALQADRRFGDEHRILRDLRKLGVAFRDAAVGVNLAPELGPVGMMIYDGRHQSAAERFLQDALERARALQEPVVVIAQIYADLGILARQQGRPTRAMDYLAEALESIQMLNRPPLEAGRYLIEQGKAARDIARQVHGRGGDVPEARYRLVRAGEILCRALDTLEAMGSGQESQAATAFIILGTIFRDSEDLARAQDCLERALEIRHELYGEGHPKVAEAYLQLGDLSSVGGHYRATRESFERALSILKEAYEPAHLQVGLAYVALGASLQRMGRLREAEEAFERALRIIQTVYGESDPQVGVMYSNIAQILEEMGDGDRALAAYGQALDILKDAEESELRRFYEPVVIRIRERLEGIAWLD